MCNNTQTNDKKEEMDIDKVDINMRLGDPVKCFKCGEESYHPFYACQRKCPLSVSNEEKDEIHYKFEP